MNERGTQLGSNRSIPPPAAMASAICDRSSIDGFLEDQHQDSDRPVGRTQVKVDDTTSAIITSSALAFARRISLGETAPV
jgi:hypothetical protein